jgi:hypothetical protein
VSPGGPRRLALLSEIGVVIVNIAQSRRRTTDPATEGAPLGGSVMQDVVGVSIAVSAVAARQVGRPAAAA